MSALDLSLRGQAEAVASGAADAGELLEDALARIAERNPALNAVIAERLGVSSHSVEKHTNAIFAKLHLSEDVDVNRRVKAVLLYLAGRTSDPDADGLP